MLRSAYLLVSTGLLAASSGIGDPMRLFGSDLINGDVATVPERPVQVPGRVALTRADDGLFYLMLPVNGQPIRFVVDTGASVVVLTGADARRAGVARSTDASTRLDTVGGERAMRWGTIDRIRLGAKDFEEIDTAIVDDGMKASLLGQNFLSRLGSVTMHGDTLELE